jgi:exopolyphosphatase/guanosine-5'-triphosphate,3'-diphosphate pyrophosphatase
MADENMRGDRKASSRTGPRKRQKAPLYAAVDLGTNNCRLLIAARKRDSFTVIDSHSQMARLGEGLEATGRMSDASIERAMDALHKIAGKLKAKKVGHVRCIATEACRRAENGADFIKRVRDETGLTFKIIGPEEEARLALIGCHNLIAPETSNVLVIDIGGGSTELSLVDAEPVQEGGLKGLLEKPPIMAWRSLPIGVVTLTEAFAHLPETEVYVAMRDHALKLVNKWKRANQIRGLFNDGKAHVIGTSGTVTCLTGVHLGLTKYRRDDVDGQWISQVDMMNTIQRLIDAGPDGRPKFPTIGEDRAALMLAGCAIVEATWSLAPGGRMRVADRGLREGLLLSMMQGPKRRKRGGKRRRSAGGGESGSAENGSNSGSDGGLKGGKETANV